MANDYFVVMPSLITGMARALDLGATFDSGSYLINETGAAADARGMALDFGAVQIDLNTAAETLGASEECVVHLQ